MVVVKNSRGEYLVKSKKNKTLGKHKTRAAALRQLRAIEANKKKR